MGYGRGKWKRTDAKPLVESAPALDVRAMLRVGALVPGAVSFVHVPDVRIMATAEPSRLVFLYPSGHTDAIPLKWVPCGLGGSRPVAHCPGCGRGALRLYFVQGRFRCRRCHNLQYAATRISDLDAARVRLARVRQRLGDEPCGPLEPAPWKPRGMWTRKYLTLLDRFHDAQGQALAEFGKRLGRLAGVV